MPAASDGGTARANVLAIRSWWAWLVYSGLIMAIGAFNLAYQGVELQGFMVMLMLALLAGGICVMALSIRNKTLGRLRLPLMVEGALGIFLFFAVWAVSQGVSDYIARNDYLVMMLAGWSLACALLALLTWRVLATGEGMRALTYARTSALLAAGFHAGLAVAVLLIGPYALTNSSEGFATNIMLLSALLLLIGMAKSLLAVEAVEVADASKMARLSRRRWWLGLGLLLTGAFLLLVGIFAYSFQGLVKADADYMMTFVLGYPYRDWAMSLLFSGGVLATVGLLLLVGSRKAYRPRRAKATALVLALVLVAEVFVAMLVVNPGALNYDGGRWDLTEGDYLQYEYDITVFTMHRNDTSAEPIDNTATYINCTLRSTVTKVAGSDDILLKGELQFEGQPPVEVMGSMPKDSQLLLPSSPMMEPSFLRQEVVSTPWGPRLCDRYSVRSHTGNGGEYAFDRWVRDGVEVLTISDYKYVSLYVDETPQEWSLRHDVQRLVDTSLEEVSAGSSDPGGPSLVAWSPQVGDRLLYQQSVGPYGDGQGALWDYHVMSVDEERLLLNLTISSLTEPVEVLSSSETEHGIQNTSLGVSFCPTTSQGLFFVQLIGNETLQTSLGQLECNHFLVLRLSESSEDQTCEDLYVHGGVLLREEILGPDALLLDLVETNLDGWQE